MKKGSLLVLVSVLFVFMAGCSSIERAGTSTSSLPVTESQQTAPGPTTTQPTTSQPVNEPTSPSKLAAPFQPIAEALLKTSDFPVVLPTYLPSPDQGTEWSLTPKENNGTFTIEIGQQAPGFTGATSYGSLSGNVGQPAEQPVEKQFETENIGVNTISLPNAINGQEYLLEGYPNVNGTNAIAWKTGQWSYFVNAYSGNGSGSTIDYARQIVNTVGKSGQALASCPGKLYFLYTGNTPLTEIYWEVNNSVWYELDWRDESNAIKILQGMVYVGNGEAK